MAKRIAEQPNVNDDILFELETPDADGLLADPIQINRVVIYEIRADYKSNKSIEKRKLGNPQIEVKLRDIRREVCQNPTEDNRAKFIEAKKKLEASSIEHAFYYQEAFPVYTIGSSDNPVWNSGNQSLLKQNETGQFEFIWSKTDRREGHYMIYWEWQFRDQILHDRQFFWISSDRTVVKTVQKYRYTPEDKYDMLIKKYMPKMYQCKIKSTDLTADILRKLNKTVATGFTMLEDMAGQLADMTDPNLTHESLLPAMANFSNLRLYSADPMRWRRQIRRSIPLNKKKGTLPGLQEALDQAGIRLIKFTKLWQVTSEYIWTDGFVITEDMQTIIGVLSKVPLGELEVTIKSHETTKIPNNYVSIVDQNVFWINEDVSLFKGDVVLIRYKIREIPPDRRQIEDYIQNLSLHDQRDEKDQEYPLKNWNSRVIEDDDPLFDRVIANRHPFANQTVFGKIRTSFLYSEKVFNMDSYNGSLRDSNDPKDIDKDFLDHCSYCQTSKFNIDIEIDELNDDRIAEAKQIIQEYTPFHSMLHLLTITITVNDFTPQTKPIESPCSMVFGTTGLKKPVVVQIDPDNPKQTICTSALTYKEGNGQTFNTIGLMTGESVLSTIKFPDLNKTNQLQIIWNWRINVI